ncbi:hypothetical protein [Arcobacter sp. LA11]|uniref:hypothetical protein n=1 Tax=Arcobacter sp. LA11 TaxID=1898176 RepID=UPI0009334217|nr:hypothetical protein [Arcobacter sp. LA11]
MKKKILVKTSIGLLTSALLLTGCANNAQIKQSKVFERIQVDNYKTNPQYYKPVVLKLPTTNFEGKASNEYNIETYDFSSDIDWLLKVKIQDHYVDSVIKTPTSYKITLSGGDGFMTFYYDYKVNKEDNSVVLTYRDNFEFRKKGGLFSMKINKVLQEYNDDSQVTFQRLDDMYFYKDMVKVSGKVISKLPVDEVKTNLETEFSNWNSKYDGTFFKGLKSQFIRWNDKDEFIGNHFYRLKNSKTYAVMYTNVQGEKLGIPLAVAVYSYRGGSKVLYGSNIKHLISTSSRETFNKKDISKLKAYIKSIVNK